MRWLSRLDKAIARRVVARIDRVSYGNFGDHKTFGALGELRFNFGGGIRVYYTIRDQQVVLLLAGGDKSSQEQDFIKAHAMIDELEV